MKNVVSNSILLISILFSTVACGQKPKEENMKLTVMKLIRAFEVCDTLGIINLFERDKELRVRKDDILNDCSFFNKIINKHGKPKFDSLILSKAENGANIVSVTLMNKNDSLLKIKKSVLIIVFYPDQFLSNPHKFLYYSLMMEPLYPRKNKIFERPNIIPKEK